jgi:voltage-gated potassium channel
MKQADAPSASYQLFMLVLCLYALASLAVQAAVRLDPAILQILEYADYGVCAIFFADFVFSLWRAESRWRYFATWGWLDLLSSIPMLDAARWGRLARIARIFRVLRGLRATRLLTTTVLRRRAENTFLAATLAAILLLVFSSIAVLQFESVEGANIKTADDAVWWAITTMTTVGYGDRYPVTGEGRFMAALLMCAGVGLFGTFSAFLASWLIAAPDASKIDALQNEIAALREAIEKMGAEQGRGEPMLLRDE